MKAKFALLNGTTVDISGDVEEVRQLLEIFSQRDTAQSHSNDLQATAVSIRTRRDHAVVKSGEATESGGLISEMAIVNRIKDDESLRWAQAILDSRDMVSRVLLPLLVASEINAAAAGLTSGFIVRVYAELGIRLDPANVSRALSGGAKKFVLADSARRQGAPVHYRISRPGRKHLEDKAVRNG